MELYFTRLHWNTHTFPVAATADGLCYVGAWDEPEDLFDDWSRKHLPRAERIASDTALAPYGATAGLLESAVDDTVLSNRTSRYPVST